MTGVFNVRVQQCPSVPISSRETDGDPHFPAFNYMAFRQHQGSGTAGDEHPSLVL